MPRPKRRAAAEGVPDDALMERELRNLIICRWARVSGDPEQDAKDALISANVQTHRSEPVPDRLGHLKDLLADLGLLAAAQRHHEGQERFRHDWGLV